MHARNPQKDRLFGGVPWFGQVNFGKRANAFWVILVSLCCGVLSACSKIAEAEEAASFAERAERVNEQRLRVLGDSALGISGLSGTVFDAVPTSGSATYRGSAFLGITNIATAIATDPAILVGDSTLTLDFGNPDDAVTGGVGNFRQTRSGDVSLNVPGQLTFTNGVIGGDAANDLAFDFAGDVTADGAGFVLSGRAEGKLRGTRTNPTAAENPVIAYEVQATDVRLNDAAGAYRAAITIIGEN